MYVRSLSIHGLADLPSFRAEDLGRQVVITGPSPAASAVGDGLALVFSALSERALSHLLLRWGLIQAPAEAEIAMEGVPIQATWTDRRLAKTIVATTAVARCVPGQSCCSITMSAHLRNHAAREPRLAVGREGAPVVSIEVSAFFGASWMSSTPFSPSSSAESSSPATNERAPALLAAQDTSDSSLTTRRRITPPRRYRPWFTSPERHAPVGMGATTPRACRLRGTMDSGRRLPRDDRPLVATVPGPSSCRAVGIGHHDGGGRRGWAHPRASSPC